MGTCYEHQIIRDINLNKDRFENTEFVGCRFENCEIENAQIAFCKFTDCTFLKCRIINPTFHHCTMTSCEFIECRLFGLNWKEVDSGFVPPIAQLKKCQIKYNNFVECNYPKFLFEDNDILESLFADCNLMHSCFCRCHLHKTEFFRCDLRGSSFEEADGYIVDISTCKLKGAVFSFPEVTNLLSGLGIVIK